MAELYKVPWYTRLARSIMRSLFRGIFHILSDVRIEGREHVPMGTSYLITVNHISLFEPPLMLAFWPEPPEAVGAAEIWERKGQNILARMYGGMAVHRGEYDRKVMDKMLAALRAGRPLLIAPEGTRSHTPGMQRAEPGVAYLVDMAQVPVVPVGIVGTTEDFFQRALHGERPVLELHIGEPLYLPRLEGTGAQRRLMRQQNADRIMSAIAALLPSEYQGVYAAHG